MVPISPPPISGLRVRTRAVQSIGSGQARVPIPTSCVQCMLRRTGVRDIQKAISLKTRNHSSNVSIAMPWVTHAAVSRSIGIWCVNIPNSRVDSSGTSSTRHSMEPMPRDVPSINTVATTMTMMPVTTTSIAMV